MKGTKFIIIFFSLFQLFAVHINAQLDISGRVFDQESKELLAGVNIIIVNSTMGTTTNNSGFFRLQTKTTLPCKIQLSMIGYKTSEIEITKNHKKLELFLLNETILSKEITVRAKEIEVEQKTFRNMISMEMLDALSIRETPSANFYEAVSHLKGVDVVMQSINFMTVNARGFNSTENTRFVQVVDGMDNMAPGMSFPIGNIAGLSELDVESVEFLPGPSEVQYGGNALNGILKMTSKDPFKYQGTSIFLKAGVSDIVPGNDGPFQFSAKPQIESAIRIAKAFNEKFAFKLNASYAHGIDWYADDTTNIRPGNIKWEYDPGYDAVNKYGDEVTTGLSLGANGANVIVSRTGYNDKELVDNEVENLKLSGALHYKINPKITAVLHGNFGSATTAYTGDNRISLSGFKIFQGKAELQGEHFLIRGYSSQQNSGNSYDAKFLAIHLNEKWSKSEDWFRDYYNAYKGTYSWMGVTANEHPQARKYADRNRLIPGTLEFENAKQEIIKNNDYREGAGIYNNSALYQADGVVDLNKYTGKTRVSLGANYRFYDLDSKGTIFPDTTGNNITIYEFGGFAEVERNFKDAGLTLNAALRFDKSEHFEGNISPRISVLYDLNEINNFRISFLTGFRNPGVKEQFINKDLGTARYLGGLEKITKPYEIELNSIYLQNVNEFNEAVKVDMESTSIPEYGLNQAIYKNLGILETGIVQKEDIQQIKAEKVFTFEGGYKTKIADIVFLDMVYYYSAYRDFIGILKVAKPRTSPQTDLFTAATQINSSTQNDIYYLHANSQENIAVQGVAVGYKWLMPMGSILSGNFTWTEMNSDADDPISPGFNTPGFKCNLSLQNRRMDKMENNPGFRNVGFKVTWRFQNRYYWESTFGNGWIEPVSVIDVQFSVNIGKPKSLVKFGASNFFNNPFSYSFGGSDVGVLFYASYIVDNLFNTKR